MGQIFCGSSRGSMVRKCEHMPGMCPPGQDEALPFPLWKGPMRSTCAQWLTLFHFILSSSSGYITADVLSLSFFLRLFF